MELTRRVVLVVALMTVCSAAELQAQYQKLSEVPFTEVRIDDEFWTPKLETVRKKYTVRTRHGYYAKQ